ncbi:Cation/H+ exchanger [Corchorus capsularis]|uniref:Cation/H+ exchanger n=1 Tax=Corchorus capsularis TaxID=210143 RepID=A0A1R3IP96_COCAP|nr:Cation/H+ exchanger [Corchorus capsularis]
MDASRNYTLDQLPNDFELRDFIDDPNFDQFIDLIRGENEESNIAGLDYDLINGCFVDKPQLQISATVPVDNGFGRGRMKEKLYALRSLVPNITKMDKASIIGDAVLYVQDLQMQAKKLKAEISGLEASLAGSERYQESMNNPAKIRVNHPICKKIFQLDMFQVEERGFYIKLVSNKGEGVAASLYKALESLSNFTLQNSNLTTVYDRFSLTFTLNMILVFFATQLVHLFLKPLGIPLLASQIVAGLILGPAMLGKVGAFKSILIPADRNGVEVIETTAALGFAIYLFLVGVKMDVRGAFTTVKRATVIGSLSILSPLIVGLVVYEVMKDDNVDHNLERVTITMCECLTSISVIACVLSELKILNSELGHLALSSATIGDLGSLIMTSVVSFYKKWGVSHNQALVNTGAMLAYTIVLIFVLRPMMFWIIRRTPEGRPVKQKYIYAIMLLALGSALFANYFGRSAIFGTFIFGLAVPDGVFVPSFCSRIPLKDSLALALIMTSKGILELSFFAGFRDNQIIGDGSFCILILGILLNSTIVPILVKFLYDPVSRKYAGYQKRNIMHLKPDSELRILACVHKPENVAALIGFLNATCPTEESPNVVYVLHLTELTARASPVFITHQKQGNTTGGTFYEKFIFAFNQYEQNNWGLVTVNAFTAISPSQLMHEDICTMALDKQTSFILLPFHRKWSIDGSIESEHSNIRRLNCSVLETAPCSIGILVDRAYNGNTMMFSKAAPRSSYCICIIFIGGKDDREALTLAKRMSQDPRVYQNGVNFQSWGTLETFLPPQIFKAGHLYWWCNNNNM